MLGNHGMLGTDHIVPKKAFGASKEDFNRRMAQDNRCGKDNLSKSDTYEEGDKIDLIERYNKEHGTKYMQNYRKFLRSLARAYNATSN